MGMPKGQSGNPKGKPKGAKNHMSKLAKENIETVFDMIGGLVNMARWAKENETEFYKHYAKLIPLTVAGDKDNPIVLQWPLPQTALDDVIEHDKV